MTRSQGDAARRIDARSLMIVCAVGVLVMGIGLGSTHLWDQDEGYFAATAAEMFQRSDPILPTFNQELFSHKPPMMYWGMMAGYKVFGVGELGARVVSALFGMGAALMTCLLGTFLFNGRLGRIAGIIVASSLTFSMVARAATADAYLTFFAITALYCFVRSGGLDGRASWVGWAAFYVAIALGVLTKGPVGLFPAIIVGIYLLATTKRESTHELTFWQRFGPASVFRTAWQMRPIMGLCILLLVAGPWLALVGWQTNGQFLSEFIGIHNIQRLTSPMQGHKGPLEYYVIASLVGLFPWSIFAAPAFLAWVRRPSEEHDSHSRRAALLVTIYAGVYLLLFTLAQTKLPNYILPAYPVLALGLAYYIDRWIDVRQQADASWQRAAFATLIGTGLLLSAGMWLAGVPMFRGESLLGMANVPIELQQESYRLGVIGVPLVLGGIAAWWLTARGKRYIAFQTLAITAIVMLALVWNYAAPLVDRYQTPQMIASDIRQLPSSVPKRIGMFGFFRPSMVFYAGQRIEMFEDGDAAAAALTADNNMYLITTEPKYREIEGALRRELDIQVIERREGFLSADDLVVLAHRPR